VHPAASEIPRPVGGETKKRDDGTLMGEYKLRVGLGRFAELIEAIEAMGRIEGRQIKDFQSGADIPKRSEGIKCEVALVIFERSRQLPSGDVSLEVKGLECGLARLRATLAETGGAIVSNRTTRLEDGSSVAELSLRVPAGGFQRLLDALPALGRLTARNVTGETVGISGGAADVPCELSLQLAERSREVPSGRIVIEVSKFRQALSDLRDLLKKHAVAVLSSTSDQRPDNTWVGSFRLGIKAKELDAVVAQLEKLGRVRTRQVRGLGLGDLTRLDPNVTGEITLSLQEPATILPEPARAGQSIRKMLRDGLAGLYTSLGLILYGLVVMAPWLVIVAVVVWLTARVLRRRAAAASQGHHGNP